jgi:hypothetical protein
MILLLLNRVDLNIASKVGETALHCAVKAGHASLVTLLVENWADLTLKSEQGTPTELAVAFHQAPIAQYLTSTIKSESQTKLPPAMWLHVFRFLEPKQLCAVGRVCKQWRRLWYVIIIIVLSCCWCSVVLTVPLQ